MAFNQALLIPTSTKALGPSFSVNGEPLGYLFEFGDDYPEFAADAAPSAYCCPNLPNLLALRSGTIIGSCTLLNYSGQDNTGGFIVGKTLVPGGSWSRGNAIVTESSRGAGNRAIANFSLLQGAPGDDTLYGLYYETVYLNNTASPWKDFAGNTIPQTVAVKIWFLTGTESAGVLSWNAATDITANIHVVNNANLLTVDSAASNADGSHGGANSYRFHTTTTINAAVGANNYFLARLANFTGTNHGTLNYAENGSVAYYCKKIDATHFDLTDAAAPGFSAGTTFGSTPTCLPELTWFLPSPANACTLASGRLYWGAYGRMGAQSQGSPVGFGIYTDDKGATWHTSTQNDLVTDIGEIEPGPCETTTPNTVVFTMRQGSGTGKLYKSSTDGGATWGAQAVDAGLQCSPTTGSLIRIGSRYFLSAPNHVSKRRRPSVFVSTNPAGGPWTSRTLYGGVSGLSALCPTPDGQILCAYGKDDVVNSFENATTLTGRIGISKFNLAAAISKTIYDYTQFAFNEGPSGVSAWTDQCQFRDIGNMGLHAQVKGSPTYGANGATFASGDYVILGDVGNSHYDPDHAATDTGEFTIEWEGSIASSGTGVIFASNSGVGANTKGITLKVTAGGFPSLTTDDGTHHNTVSGGIQVMNDGARYRIVATRSVSGATSEIDLTIYNATTGAVLEEDAQPNDGTSTAQGSLANIAQQKCLLRYIDTATGQMSQACTTRLFRFTKKAHVAPLPFPYVPPAAETFPAGTTNSPDAVCGADLDMWLLRNDCAFSARGLNGSSTTSLNPADGSAALVFVDYINGWVAHSSSFAGPQPVTMKDPTCGRYIYFPLSSAGSTWTTNATAGHYDYLHTFTAPYTMFGKMRIPTAQIAAGAVQLIDTKTGSTYGIQVVANYLNIRRFEIHAVNVHNSLDLEFGQVASPLGQWAADTDYFWAIVFSGTGGAFPNFGFTFVLVPLVGNLPVTAAIVAANQNSNMQNGWVGGDSTSSSGASSVPIAFGKINTDTICGKHSDLCIVKRAMSNADLAKVANWTATNA